MYFEKQAIISGSKFLIIGAAIGLFLACLGSPLRAAIIAEDFFTSGSGAFLQGKNTGSGFGASSFWDGAVNNFNEDPRNRYPGLSYPSSSSSAGLARFRGDFRELYRTVDGGSGFTSYLDGSGNIGADGTELWFNFLLGRDDNVTAGGSFGMSLLRDAADANTNDDVILYLSSDLDAGRFRDSDTHMIAVHMEFAAGSDTYTVYVDPDLSLAPTGGAVNTIADLSFDMIRMEGRIWGSPTSHLNFDEIRFGETASDIGFATVPEPRAYALLLSAFAVFYWIRHSRIR
ncbi:MAG: hypothetical protein AAF558_07420 [Verrucomicrobiota bacterium]